MEFRIRLKATGYTARAHRIDFDERIAWYFGEDLDAWLKSAKFPEDCELEQSTGFFDSENKEIYVGDRIRYGSFDFVVRWSAAKGTFVIKSDRDKSFSRTLRHLMLLSRRSGVQVERKDD